MNKETKNLLAQIADLHSVPQGAYNIRENGKLLMRSCSKNIKIESKQGKSGIDIYVADGTKNESVHIPVVVTEDNLQDLVYNDFYIGDNCDVLIVAGCGIHSQSGKTGHDGIHTFWIGKNSKIRYVEKHLGLGKITATKVLNPTTICHIGQNSTFKMETMQLKGVSYANRKTVAYLKDGASILIDEKILTENSDITKTSFVVHLIGKDSKADVVSRAVAKDNSCQHFASNLKGKNQCFGHVECDGVVSDNAKITSTPKIEALSCEAMLTHEAAIGKISAEQILKLQTLGLSSAEAEKKILEGFLEN